MNSSTPHVSRRAALSLGIVGGGALAAPILAGASPAQAESIAIPAKGDATAILQAAVNKFAYVEIPPGDYTIGTVYVPSNRTIHNRGNINGTLQIIGSTRNSSGIYHTNRVNGAGSLARGVTTLPGSFSGFAVGDFVMIGLQGIGLATSNQSGFDFARVTAVSASGLTIDTATRWSYPDWYVAKAVGTMVTGDLPRGTSSVPGDFTGLFKKGDLVRVENINGDDTMWTATGTTAPVAGNDKAYFEPVRVKGIDDKAIVFEQEIAYHHQGFYLVRMDPASNVRITGGYISRVIAMGCDTLAVTDVRCSLLSVAYTVGLHVSGIRADGDTPRVCGFTAIRDATISDVVTRGANGNTDNGAFKMNQPINVTVTGITSFDTTSSSTTQGLYPFFIDFYFTPYSGWAQSVTVGDLSLSKPKNGVAWSLWTVGTRDCRVSNVVAQGGIRFSKSIGINASGLRAGTSINIEENVDGALITSFRAGYVNIFGGTDIVLSDGILDGARGGNRNRAIRITRARTPELSSRVQLSNIKNLSTTDSDVTVHIEYARDVAIMGCSDRPEITASVEIGDNVQGVKYGPNFFANPVAGAES